MRVRPRLAGWLLAAAALLASCGAPAEERVPKLIPQLLGEDRQAQTAAVEEIVDIGSDAVPILLHALDTGDDGTRMAVAFLFGRAESGEDAPEAFHSDAVGKALCRAASSAHWGTRVCALRALAVQGWGWRPDVYRATLAALDEEQSRSQEDPDVPHLALMTAVMCRLDERNADLVPILLPYVEASKDRVREFAIGKLREIGPAAREALPTLERVLAADKERLAGLHNRSLEEIVDLTSETIETIRGR